MMHWGIYSQWGCIESWPLVEVDRWARPDDLQAVDRAEQGFRAVLRRLPRAEHDVQPPAVRSAAWAAAAKDAGMKYVVFTTKHHDGFCMFDTKQTDYRTTHASCPFHADPRADAVKAVFDAFRKEGFGIGAYYSKSDWHHPGYWAPDRPHPNRNVNYDTKKYPAEMADVRRFHPRHRRGVDERLWADRHPLARRRTGPAARAGHRHAAPGRHGPAASAGPDRRRPHGRRPLRELSHAGAGSARQGPALCLGNLPDDGRPMVVQARRQVQVHAAR